ncbi:MAG: NAD(P)-dependent alcohol dehydrogenase [Sphingomonas sp.]
MKAMVLGQSASIETLRCVDLPDPGDPGPGEIRVRLQACSLNFHDLGVAAGHLPAAEGRILLSDGAGTVEAVGAGVSEFAVGDLAVSLFFPDWQDGEPRTIGFGRTPGDGIDGYAREAVVAPATWFTRVPAGYTAEQAATLPTAALTAWRALVVHGGLKAGDTVLLLGTGGVSIFALQFARAMGATVIITSSSDEKLERARALGADHGINYRQRERWSEAVMELTGGRGADHVVEVGGPGTLPLSIEAGRIGGHIALIGVLTGGAGPVPTGLLMMKQQRLHGLIVGNRQHQQDMVRALEATGIKPVVASQGGLEDLPAAFGRMARREHFGKMSLTF